MSGPSPALSALARIRRLTVDARAREVTELQRELAEARARRKLAQASLAERRAQVQELVVEETRYLASGKARVVDLLWQERYLRRAEDELRTLGRAVEEAGHEVAARQEALRQAQEACAAAHADRRAVERRLREQGRALARRVERAEEERVGDAFAARWRSS